MTEKKSSHDDDRLDFGKLEKELENAVEADKRYWRENDAKFRAVNQKVESYEEFRDIVLASHIKPLGKGDNFADIKFDVKWNSTAAKNEKSDTPKSGEIKQEVTKLPKDSQEFVRDWRRYYKTPAEQYNFLIALGSATLAKIFRTEISLFGDILKALNSELKDSDCDTVKDILEKLSEANRFSLSVQFLNSSEKEAAKSLLAKLKTVQKDDDASWDETIRLLEKKYEIK